MEVTATVERGAHLIGVYVEAVLGELAITQGEAHVLAHLARHGPTSIATLHREFGHKRSTLTNIIDRLEQRKLVRRELNPHDRRSFVVHLSAAGRRTARPVVEALDQLERELTDAAGKRDLDGLAAIVEALETITQRQSLQSRARQ